MASYLTGHGYVGSDTVDTLFEVGIITLATIGGLRVMKAAFGLPEPAAKTKWECFKERFWRIFR